MASSSVTGLDVLVTKTNRFLITRPLLQFYLQSIESHPISSSRHTIPMVKIREEPWLEEPEWAWLVDTSQKETESLSSHRRSDRETFVPEAHKPPSQTPKSFSNNSLKNAHPLNPQFEVNSGSLSSISSAGSFLTSTPSLLNLAQVHTFSDGQIHGEEGIFKESRENSVQMFEDIAAKEFNLPQRLEVFQKTFFEGMAKLSLMTGVECKIGHLFHSSPIIMDEEKRILVILLVHSTRG